MREDDVLGRRVESASERQNRWLADRLEESDKKLLQERSNQPIEGQPPSEPPSIPPVFVPAGEDPYEKEMEYEPQSPRLVPGTPPGTPPADTCFEISDDEAEMVGFLRHLGVNVDGLNNRIQELNIVQTEMSTILGMEVSEVYSPARVIKLAEKYGLQKGVALDLTTCDEHGNP